MRSPASKRFWKQLRGIRVKVRKVYNLQDITMQALESEIALEELI